MLDTPDLIVSEFRFSGLEEPTVLEGRTIVENGYRCVLFEYAKEWYEIMKIWDKEGELVGYYCNINTPPKRFEGGYEVTDLFLDLWVFPDLEHHILDEHELERAVARGWIDKQMERIARNVLADLVRKVEMGDFPPDIVNRFD